MISEFFMNLDWYHIINGLVLGVLFARISNLKEDILSFKECMLESKIGSLERSELKYAERGIFSLRHALESVDQRLTMRLDYLNKEVEELKKK